MNRHDIPEPWSDEVTRRVDLAHEPAFDVGPVRVDPAHRRLTARRDEVILEPKVMQVFVALSRDPDRIWSRDDLIAACWDGVIVGDDAITRVISQLRKRLAALAGEAVEIETVTKVGYQLRVASDIDAQEGAATGRHWIAPAATLAALLMVIALVAWRAGWIGSEPQGSLPDVTSVAIMPIETASEEDDALAAGLRSTLAATLNGTGRMRVSGLESAEYLASRGYSPAAIGEELDQEHVVQLRLSTLGGQVEVQVLVHDIGEGEVSERQVVRRPMDSILMLEAELAQAVAAAIPSLALSAWSTQSDPRVGLGGEDEGLYLAAVGLLRDGEYDGLVRAEAMLRQLARSHPGSGAVKAMLSAAISQRLSVDPDRPLGKFFDQEAIALAREARHLAPNLADAHVAEALARGPILEMLPLVERAAELDPYHPPIQNLLSETRSAGLNFEGQWEARYRRWQLEPLDGDSTEISTDAAAMGMDSLADQLDQDYATNHPDPKERLRARSRMAERRGDLSEAVRLRFEALPDEAGQARTSNLTRLAMMRNAVGLEEPASLNPAREIAYRMMAGSLPSKAELAQSGIWEMDFFETWRMSRSTVKLMADDGRHEELVALFDRYFESPEDFRAQLAGRYSASLRKLVYMAPYLAISMRAVGRDEDATRLLDLAVSGVRDAQRHGRIPDFFHVEAARVYATRGDKRRAIEHLGAAVEKQWLFNAPQMHFPGLGDASSDSALASLRGELVVARFDTQLNGWRDRERAEAIPFFRLIDERTAFDLHH